MISDRLPWSPAVSQSSNDTGLLQIIDLVADTLGIHIQPQHHSTFQKTLLDQAKLLGLSSLSDYYQLLALRKQLLLREIEWQNLIPLLTVTESYFFRDQGQFSLLKSQILPELIERKRLSYSKNSIQSQKPTLRIWSAGCSTGEEAYSLAILIKELIPDYQAWEILILGTDINQPAIELARQGIYSDWSFRMIDPDIKKRYFRSHLKGWKIDYQIQKMVTFQAGNLMQDHYPDSISGICNLDLILCRNVFIYFNFNTIAQVLEKFYRSLAPGGFLLTGHTELHGQKIEPLQVRSFPQSIVFQREIDRLQKSPLSNPTFSHTLLERESVQKNTPSSNGNPHPYLQSLGKTDCLDSQTLPCSSLSKEAGVKSLGHYSRSDAVKPSLNQEVPRNVTHPNPAPSTLDSKPFQTYCLSAETYANLGQYPDAIQACQQALQIDPFATEPYYLLAQISEEQGNLENAKSFLKRIVYLAPNSVSAYLELGAIYERENKAKQAQKIWQSLLEILQHLPEEQAIADGNQQSVADIRSYVLKHLETNKKQQV